MNSPLDCVLNNRTERSSRAPSKERDLALEHPAQSRISEGHQRTAKARRNILASFFIKGASILVGLMLVPLAISYVDETRYGIWITLSSVVAWMSFLDIGLGHGLRNRFAEALARGQDDLARIYVSTTYAILCLIMGAVFVLFVVVNPLLNWPTILNSPPEMAEELSMAALVVFGVFCLQLVLRLLQTIFTADQHPAKASVLPLLGNALALGVIYALTKCTDGSLIYLVLTLTLAPAVVLLIATVAVFKGRYRPYAPSLKYVRFGHSRHLMSLGMKFFVIQMAFILMFQTSNIIISQLFGPQEVTPYNIAFRYFGVLTMLFAIIISPCWSAITEAYTKGDIDWIRKTMRNLQYCFMLTAVLAIFMLLVADWVYALWVGRSIRIPTALSLSVALYIIINAWNAIYSNFLNGIGKVQLQLYCGMTGALLNVPLAIFLGNRIGIEGVILAPVAISLFGVAIYPIQYRKIINKKACGIWAA